MFAPVIGSPASSSQNMISRYSCSATVAVSCAKKALLPGVRSGPTDTSDCSAALHQRGNDGLVEAVAHRGLGDGDVVPGGERGAQARVALGPVGYDEEAADR